VDLGHDVVDVNRGRPQRRASSSCVHWRAGWRSSWPAWRFRQRSRNRPAGSRGRDASVAHPRVGCDLAARGGLCAPSRH